MAKSFHWVHRSLSRDTGFTPTLFILTALLLLAAWAVWAFRAQLTRYAVSDSAHLANDPARPGSLQVVAQFPPSSAAAKLHPGERAILHAQGFPQAQNGALSARVVEVARELRDGKVQVDLAIASTHSADFPLRAGWPVKVQIEVERVSPAVVVLRSAGELAGAR